MRYELALRKLVEFVARRASALNQRYELRELVSPSITPLMDKAIDKIVLSIVRRDSGLWCNLCDKGPFTKRGFYLHLIRVHQRDIEFMVKEELNKLLEVVNKTSR
ncbi:MAG: hypothetical protein LM582_02510 [Desulfurococcaceae archaeon]|jgi:hypothetical protein|nr:hypothetical protein [Desulfurococcaceae archaeon]MCC6058588.1 hypothetical protein [Desulfurococcaceae archaeon]